MRALALALSLVALAASSARAQPRTPYDLEGLRAHAAEWGLRQHETSSGESRTETWCPVDVECDERAPEHVVLRFDHGALVLLSVRRPRFAEGWDVQVVLQPALSGAFSMLFERGSERLVLAYDLTVEHFDFGVSVPFTEEEAERGYAALVAEAFDAYLASPDEMIRYARSRTDRLRASVRAHLAGYSTCDEPHAPGRFVERDVDTPSGPATGIFDTCVRRSLSEAERTELVRAIDAEMDRRDALVSAHAATFQRAVRLLLGLSPAGA